MYVYVCALPQVNPCVWCEVEILVHFFSIWIYSVISALFVEKTFFSLLDCFGAFVKNAINAGLFLSALFHWSILHVMRPNRAGKETAGKPPQTKNQAASCLPVVLYLPLQRPPFPAIVRAWEGCSILQLGQRPCRSRCKYIHSFIHLFNIYQKLAMCLVLCSVWDAGINRTHSPLGNFHSLEGEVEMYMYQPPCIHELCMYFSSQLKSLSANISMQT